MKGLTVGIIGAGFAANLHAEALKKVHDVDVRIGGVVAGAPQHAAEFARRHDIPTAYATYGELLAASDIDVVDICVPNALHAPFAVEAANAGKHVMCEKPLTGAFGGGGLAGPERAQAERAEAMASVAEVESAIKRNGVLFMYAENWIYAPAMTKTKRLLEVAKGSIVDIRAEESHSGSHAVRSRRRKTAGGGALLMLGAHPIGAAIHLKSFEGMLATGTPTRVVAVTADVASMYETPAVKRAGSQNRLVSDWEDVETWANVVLTFDDGTKAAITASFAMLGGVRNSFEVYTTNAAVRSSMTPNDGLLVFTPDPEAFGTEYLHEKVESRAGWNSASPDEDWVRGYPHEMQDFIECLALGRPPVSDLQLARDVVDVIYASYVSAEEGRRVDVADELAKPPPQGKRR
jgi:predicted dehydrogenase